MRWSRLSLLKVDQMKIDLVVGLGSADGREMKRAVNSVERNYMTIRHHLYKLGAHCIHAQMHRCTHTYTQMHLHTCTHTCTHTHTHTHAHTRRH